MNDDRGPGTNAPAEMHYTPARRSSRRSSTGWLKGAVALAVLAIVAGAFFLWPRDLAKALEKGMAAQKAAKSLVAKGKMTLNMDIGMGEQKIEMPMTMSVVQPNKMAMSMGEASSPFSMKLVCDGTNLWFDMPMLGQVIQAPAPKSLEDMAKSELPSMAPGGGKGLMPGQLTKEDIAKVTNGLPRDNAWYKTLAAPDGTRAATVETKEGLKLAVWVDPRSGIVYQVATDMNADSMKKAMAKKDAKTAASMPANMKMSMKMVFTFDQFDLDATVGPEKFKYSVPSGRKVTKVKSLDALKSGGAFAGMGG